MHFLVKHRMDKWLVCSLVAIAVIAGAFLPLRLFFAPHAVHAQTSPMGTLVSAQGFGPDFQTNNVLSINPSTGAVTPIGSTFALTGGLTQGVSALDPVHHILYVETASPTDGLNSVVGLDTQTGAIVSSAALPSGYGFGFLQFEAAPALVTTTTTLASSIDPSVVDQKVTYTATVSPVPDGGRVSFSQVDSTTPITGCGNVSVDATTGIATCPVTYSGTGSYSITASYSGDTNFLASGSANLTQYVDSVSLSGYLHNGVFNLRDTNLAGAYLAGVDLSGANLSNANFSSVDFTASNLSSANLSDGKLSNANLTSANLSAANLANANVKGVIWDHTICPDGTNSDNDGGSCVGHL